MTTSDALLHARALVLADLQAKGFDGPRGVSMLEDSLAERRWWVDQWPQGASYVAGQVAQDVQDALLDNVGRWPLCTACDAVEPHELHIEPELGEDPHWVCHRSGIVVSALGELRGNQPS